MARIRKLQPYIPPSPPPAPAMGNTASIAAGSRPEGDDDSMSICSGSDRPATPDERPPEVHLPDEILLEILSYLSPLGSPATQKTLYAFCLVKRQWWSVGVPFLYQKPYILGKGYDLFVRTVCPSINMHIRKSELARFVKVMDLSHIVHQGSKSVTARLLGRTKLSLEAFVAPQAGFAVNCWAALSKCTGLKKLDLRLVSEGISFQALSQTLRHLRLLEELYFPRCSWEYDLDSVRQSLATGRIGVDLGGSGGYSSSTSAAAATLICWPPRLRTLQLAGRVQGKFMADLYTQPESLPPTLTNLSLSHCPGVVVPQIHSLLQSLGPRLRCVELRDLPLVQMGEMSYILAWCPELRELTIAIDYIDIHFGHVPRNSQGDESSLPTSPLQSLTLLACGNEDPDTDAYFQPLDLHELISAGHIPHLWRLFVAMNTKWHTFDDGAQWSEVEGLMQDKDRENFYAREGRFEGLSSTTDLRMRREGSRKEGTQGRCGYEEWVAKDRERQVTVGMLEYQ